MPNSANTALAFALLIVPGFVFLSGFSAARARGTPERDLYALAQAVVVSLLWLVAVYLLQWALADDLAADWGLLPLDADVIDGNRVRTAAVGLVTLLAAPFAVGALWGSALNRWARGDHLDKPEAWEAAWASSRRYEREHKNRSERAPTVAVTAVLKNGERIVGDSERDVDVDYAPNQRRDMFLRRAVHLTSSGREIRYSPIGAYVAGSEIAAVFFGDTEERTS